MQARKDLLGVATFPCIKGKEKELLALLERGPVRIAQETGGTLVAIYFHPAKGHYVATAHWPDRRTLDRFMNSPKLQDWATQISSLCREPISRAVYDIVEERVM